MTTSIRISQGATNKPKAGLMGALGMTDEEGGLAVEIGTDDTTTVEQGIQFIQGVAASAVVAFNNVAYEQDDEPEPIIDEPTRLSDEEENTDGR